LLHKNILDHFNASDKEVVEDIITSTKHGRSIWFREFVSVVQNGDSFSFESLLFNISDFKEREIELNQIISEKTELNSSKDKLISIVSHDLRAPFSSLLGFSEILINENNLSEDERNEYLQYIYDASKTQLEMVNNLLDWTRLQMGNIKFNPERLDIRGVVDNSVSVLTGSTIRKDISIKVNGDYGLYVKADEKLVTQVVTNLLSNAVKFTPPGKNIEVNIGLYQDNMVELVVSDEGIGIDEENQVKIFKIDAKFSKIGTR
jgi:signal transduction histidine kinase